MEDLKPEVNWGRMLDTRDRKPKNMIRRKDFYIVVGILIVFMLGGFLLIGIQINSLRGKVNAIQASALSQSVLPEEIQHKPVTGEIEAQAQIVHYIPQGVPMMTVLNKADCKIVNKDIFNRQVTLLLTAQPKEYTKQTAVSFKVYSDGNVVGTVEANRDNEPEFQAYIDVPMVGNITTTVIVDERGTKKVEDMQPLDLHEYYLLEVESFLGNETYTYKEETFSYHAEIETQVFENYAYGIEPNLLKSLNVIAYVDGKEVKKFSVNMKQENTEETMFTFVANPEWEIPLKANQTLEISMEGKDSFGYSYKQTLGKYAFSSDGTRKERAFSSKTRIE